ncbi:Integrase core domain-containing protein [Paenibacillus sp. 1_12]|uniref:IS3 family transposase n=1 Tax=Paenibacillus sp. 1_12 TaxID=1566278 RepID=UPI0008EBCBB0|nr:IS3 family transposase [Paenibacillus sp. 1_12]SFM28096.1 Integrase core domain-containing protein [Paenibacillus sp. 1_12]
MVLGFEPVDNPIIPRCFFFGKGHFLSPTGRFITPVGSDSGEKLYLLSILNLYNGEIITYTLESRTVYSLVATMLDQAFECLHDDDSLLIHSDQGWRYQMSKYNKAMKERGITQIMSYKGNCNDNGVIESFFGTLKSELLYVQDFESIEQFKVELDHYMNYNTHKRIKKRLKDMCPVQYRTHAFMSSCTVMLSMTSK